MGQGKIECTASLLLVFQPFYISVLHVFQAFHVLVRIYLLHCGLTAVRAGGSLIP